MQVRVYDCFPFFNELDVLELRLKTLWDHVDQFVLFTGTQTFSGHDKPDYYMDNRERFKPWADKIRHITLPKMEGTPWERDYSSRDCMPLGFQDASPGDLIFQSDCDEIWKPQLRDHNLMEPGPLIYGQRMFYYRLNMERVPRIVWYGSRRVRAGEWPGGMELRNLKSPVLQNAGWHFSFLGDAAAARRKILAYAHQEYAPYHWSNEERLGKMIETGEDLFQNGVFYRPVPVDESFPAPILEDPKRWKHLIR